MFWTADSLVISEKCSNFVADLINKAYLSRRTRILLLILAAVLYFCSMACSASVRVEMSSITDLTEDVCARDYHLTQGGMAFFESADEALPIARVKRTVQITSPTKVMKDRISSCGPRPKTIALAYKQHVTSYLQYSELIFLSLPSEEIAFPFVTFL